MPTSTTPTPESPMPAREPIGYVLATRHRDTEPWVATSGIVYPTAKDANPAFTNLAQVLGPLGDQVGLCPIYPPDAEPTDSTLLDFMTHCPEQVSLNVHYEGGFQPNSPRKRVLTGSIYYRGPEGRYYNGPTFRVEGVGARETLCAIYADYLRRLEPTADPAPTTTTPE